MPSIEILKINLQPNQNKSKAFTDESMQQLKNEKTL